MGISKDFPKVVGKIRADLGTHNYPKAMMTGAQMMNLTATVNCGGERLGFDFSDHIAQAIMEDDRFKDFLDKYSAKAYIENARYAGREYVQIRINYPEEVLPKWTS